MVVDGGGWWMVDGGGWWWWWCKNGLYLVLEIFPNFPKIFFSFFFNFLANKYFIKTNFHYFPPIEFSICITIFYFFLNEPFFSPAHERDEFII